MTQINVIRIYESEHGLYGELIDFLLRIIKLHLSNNSIKEYNVDTGVMFN